MVSIADSLAKPILHTPKDQTHTFYVLDGRFCVYTNGGLLGIKSMLHETMLWRAQGLSSSVQLCGKDGGRKTDLEELPQPNQAVMLLSLGDAKHDVLSYPKANPNIQILEMPTKYQKEGKGLKMINAFLCLQFRIARYLENQPQRLLSLIFVEINS